MKDDATVDSRFPTLLLNLLVFAVATAVALLFVEGLVRLFNLLPHQRAAAAIRTETDNENENEAGGDDEPFSMWILHPYRGITPRPLFETPKTASYVYSRNVLGIRSDVVDPRELPEDDFVVAIFGGSVARSTALQTGHRLAAALKAARGPDGSPVRVVNFAVSGYKQPQQLFLLAELLLLDTPLDVVVNLDGFNEVALAATDADHGHHPLYPPHNFWVSGLGLSTGSLSGAQIELAAEARQRRRQASELRDRLHRRPVLRRSALVRAVVGTVAGNAEAEAVAAEEALGRLPTRTPAKDLFRLADPCLGKEDQCWDLIINLWIRSSHLMKTIAEAAGAEYFHVLQPNQYLAGSKQLSSEEMATAWAPERPWSRSAARGYPLLRDGGQVLRRRGVRFLDLTRVFAGHPEPIYRDSCCHYNRRGYEILASEMGRLIGEALAQSDDREPQTGSRE
ncbi:MAG: hypothetical protein GY856_08725 [bacterium]|nr:hypothetical protein [bacterium]